MAIITNIVSLIPGRDEVYSIQLHVIKWWFWLDITVNSMNKTDCYNNIWNIVKAENNLGPSWSLSYYSRIYNYLCNQCKSPLKLWVKPRSWWYNIIQLLTFNEVCLWLYGPDHWLIDRGQQPRWINHWPGPYSHE